VNLADGAAGCVSRYSSNGILFLIFEVWSLADDEKSGSELSYSSKVIFFLPVLGPFGGIFSGRGFDLDEGTVAVE